MHKEGNFTTSFSFLQYNLDLEYVTLFSLHNLDKTPPKDLPSKPFS